MGAENIVQPSSQSLTPEVANLIIKTVGSSGIPPEYGFQFFSVGLEPYLNTIETEYLSDFIKSGGGAFKMVVGTYGGGKTHLLYSVRERAWKHNYVTAYITLNPEETPFHKLELVYKAIATNLVYPQRPEELLKGYGRGIEAILKNWYYLKLATLSKTYSGDDLMKALNTYASNLGPYESTSFQNAVKFAFLKMAAEDEEALTTIIQWLKGEGISKTEVKPFKIVDKIDKSTAFRMIRCLIKWIQDIGYAGIIVFLDEAEQTASISTKQKTLLLQNLRELIDASAGGQLKRSMFFYAVPDENFLEGKAAVYEAVKQRLTTIFDMELNPTGVKIELEKLSGDPVQMLIDIGKKLGSIYEVAYNVKFVPKDLETQLQQVAKETYEERYGDIGYKRQYVQKVVNVFHQLSKKQVQ